MRRKEKIVRENETIVCWSCKKPFLRHVAKVVDGFAFCPDCGAENDLCLPLPNVDRYASQQEQPRKAASGVEVDESLAHFMLNVDRYAQQEPPKGHPLRTPTASASTPEAISVPPTAPSQQQDQSQPFFTGALGRTQIIAACVFAGLLFAYYAYDTFSDGPGVRWRESQRTKMMYTARTKAEQFVKDRLKAPSTASFPWSDSEWKVKSLGNGRYRVISHVDSQNGFGAMIRMTFICVVQDLGGIDSWQLVSLETIP